MLEYVGRDSVYILSFSLFQLHYTSHTKYYLSKVPDQASSSSDPGLEMDETIVQSRHDEENITQLDGQSFPNHVTSPQVPILGAAASKDVGRSADLYATIVVEKLPKVIFVFIQTAGRL